MSGVFSEETQMGRKKEVGLQRMDRQAEMLLSIPKKKPTEAQQELLDHIGSTFDLTDFTPMNSKYGPTSGMTAWERLIRAFQMDLLDRPLSKQVPA